MAQTFQEVEVINRLKIDYVMKGDIFIGSGTTPNSATSDINILPVGSSGSVLVANTTATYGAKWDTGFIQNLPVGVLDNTIVRWNQTGATGSVGKYIQSSNIVIDDSGNMTNINSMVIGLSGATREPNFAITVKGLADPPDSNGMYMAVSGGTNSIPLHWQDWDGTIQFLHVNKSGQFIFGASNLSANPTSNYRLDVRAGQDNLAVANGAGKINATKGYFMSDASWPSWTTVSSTTATTGIAGTSFGPAGHLSMQISIPTTNTTSDYAYAFDSTVARATTGAGSTVYIRVSVFVDGVQNTASERSSSGPTLNSRGNLCTSGILTSVRSGATLDVRAALSAVGHTFSMFERSFSIQRYNPQ